MPFLPKEYLDRMEQQLKSEFPAYLSAMEQPPQRALRVNTVKTDSAALSLALGGLGAPVEEISDAYLVRDEAVNGKHPLHAAGLFYLQEASAQYPASLFTVHPEMTVLDLCAAPGGKTTQLAARMNNGGVLFSNEYVAQRANILVGNVERMGVGNTVVTNMEPKAITERLEGLCDAVLVDAPCAGEGMFRKDPDAVTQWSPMHVETCAQRQRGILADAARAVKGGGELVYSTCSFSEAENEQTVEWFLKKHPDFSLVKSRRLYPHNFPGEGQFAALLVRRGDRRPTAYLSERSDACPPYAAFSRELAPLGGTLRVLRDGRVLLLPPLPCSLSGLRVVRGGVLLGEVKGTRFEPSHALAMLGRTTPFLHTEPLTETEAVRYLMGEPIARTCPKGYLAVTLQGHALGLAKANDGWLKNHYPKGLRHKAR